jgi:predicted GH43/DUF377 family glycosyl hydrolase
METSLERLIKKLGDGHVETLKSGETIFKLDPYEGNPIVKPQQLGLVWREGEKSCLGAVFNPGAVLYRNMVMLAPRCHRNYRRVEFFDGDLGIKRYAFENYVSEVWMLASHDGVKFDRYFDTVIRGDGSEHKDFLYGIEDIRMVEWKQKYLLIGCGKIKPPFKGTDADRVAIYSTEDFKTIKYHGIIRNFDSRNAVPIFTEDKAYILLRLHPNIYLFQLEEGINQLLNPTQYEKTWEKIHRKRSECLLLEAGRFPHEREKIGAGPPPIKTNRGWLLLYHAVGEIEQNICKQYGLSKGIKRGYSICAAVLDLEEPHKVLCRTKKPLYIPSKPYEHEGNRNYPVDVPMVVFPTGAITSRGKLLIYSGAGDKYVTLLSCRLDSLMDYLFEQCSLA